MEIYKLCNNLGGVERFLGTIALVVIEQPPLGVSSGYLESLQMDRHVILYSIFQAFLPMASAEVSQITN